MNSGEIPGEFRVNSGEFWPRNSFLKWPGEITVVIGKPIETADRTSREIMVEVENFIEGEMEKIEVRGPHYPVAKVE